MNLQDLVVDMLSRLEEVSITKRFSNVDVFLVVSSITVMVTEQRQ